MKAAHFTAQELRTWLESNKLGIKQEVLSRPVTAHMESSQEFILALLAENGVAFDGDDYACQRVLSVASTWVMAWRLGYQ